MEIVNDFSDYEIIDASNGEKLERWGNIYLLRPDPEIIWDNGDLFSKYRKTIDAVYHRSSKGGGSWENFKDMPLKWNIKYADLLFNLKQMGFKHTGLFPEQAINWKFIKEKIKDKKDVKVLNLFAYTGASSIAALKAGASVVHVDSSKGMNEWCKENVCLNHLEDKNIRFITDDVLKFVKREIRRGNKYDGIIMDPPSFGRGANKEIWNFEDNINELIELTINLLSDKALFYIVNSYSAGFSGTIIANIIKLKMPNRGIITTSEIGLPIKNGLILPCGVYTRWESEES